MALARARPSRSPRGRMGVRQIAAGDLVLEDGEAPYDFAFTVRVGAFDGRHPLVGRVALARLATVLVPEACSTSMAAPLCGRSLSVAGGSPRALPLAILSSAGGRRARDVPLTWRP